MKKLCLFLAFACLSLITGCNGHSDSNNNNGGSDQTLGSISLAIVDSKGNAKASFNKDETILVRVTVLSDKNKVISGTRVDYTADLAVLSAASKLSDSSGVAEVSISNASGEIGAGTVTASIGELTASADYEFINNDVDEATPTITTSMNLAGVEVNQFKSDQTVQIVSILLDQDGQAMSNKIISYTADVGTLSTSTALTNADGKASVSLSGAEEGIGAGAVTASYTHNGSQISNQFNYQIVSQDTVIDDEIRLGYFDDNNAFVEGKIKLSVADNTISAGGTLGLSVSLVDNDNNLVNTPTPVAFSSNCTNNNNATIDDSVLSINGKASATFADVNCAGVNGTDDIIIATVSINGVTNTANETISITGERLGSIEFISAEPSSIVLKGTGGQDKQENSTLTFKVKSDLGNELAQQQVNFTLDTTAGGITLSRAQGFTNSQGLITTQVSAGTVPTAVRVTATANMMVGSEEVAVKSQSDLLSINTGLPEQRSFTMSADIINIEGKRYDGEEAKITVWLADNFNNPVPDGTTVNFTAEGGQIQPSCITENGNCQITFTSAEPRLDDHRVTVLATVLGHETFFDTNGNNSFDDADGDAIVDMDLSSGLVNHGPETSGFLDMTEAWRDDNENRVYDNGETFIDMNNNQSFDSEDSLFNGPQCEGAKCAAEGNRSIHVRKSLVLIMSDSFADFLLTNGDGSVTYENNAGQVTPIPDVADGGATQFNFLFSDTAGQPMPQGTTVTVTASKGEVAGSTSFTQQNSNIAGWRGLSFFISNEAGNDPETSVITINVTTPKGNTTTMVTSVNLL